MDSEQSEQSDQKFMAETFLNRPWEGSILQRFIDIHFGNLEPLW